MIRLLLFVFLLHGTAAVVTPPPKWQTLSGGAPVVVARGGFSGLFPESSEFAYKFAQSTSLKDVVMLCDLQLTKDGFDFCQSGVQLDNSTTIGSVFPDGQKTYTVNGKPLRGWFSVDYTADQIYENVSLIQNIFSRPSAFDGLPVYGVANVLELRPFKFWINVEHPTFLKEHDLDAAAYLTSSQDLTVDYISSPEIGFLKSLHFGRQKPKSIFKFLEENAVEPSTNKTYKDLLGDLSTVKPFAAGILVPKNYIWPVNKDLYLQPPTTLVADAHRLGLEVYAYEFANDLVASYNYSFDPTFEYLQFIDNSNFAVDGVLTDFPATASAAVACLAHNNDKPLPTGGRPLIITHNGASGVFAGSTDLAYQQAVRDGADVLDCSVQMSKDGVVFCSCSADLMTSTTAVTVFMTRASMVPEIQKNNGIFSFDLTWTEIQSLKPDLTSPFAQAGLHRNPAQKNAGKFMTLPDFLNFAKTSNVSGVLINIQNAAFLASKKGLGIVDAVSSALANATLDKKQVFIQSDDTSVLSAFKKTPSYKRVLLIDEVVSDAPKPAVDEIKQFADSVSISRSSIVVSSNSFTLYLTDIVKEMQAAKLSVYISIFRNEFLSIAFDYFSDPLVELATYVNIGVDGVITEFPATAAAYFRSPCSDPNAKLSYSISAIQPGDLLGLAPPEVLPPAEAPSPALNVANIADPPLPPVATRVGDGDTPAADASEGTPPSPGGQPATAANAPVCLLTLMLSFVALRLH
ncbi:glycerophosphodiester phosphodiesterase GDPDL7-like isoform X2 [Canna indica]|uniref:glycerophosphodiester phosphodiesterase n=1 Tax=Canna indica TaxID=4628 RepID=A0AAQ3K4D9_9LILI|nr:glycerophosphodiester phosphodiesterase GDPDL7-like isoform X2 [Canna indica]